MESHVDVLMKEAGRGVIAHVTLDNPEKRNVLALDTMLELDAALREIATTEALGVILAAAVRCSRPATTSATCSTPRCPRRSACSRSAPT